MQISSVMYRESWCSGAALTVIPPRGQMHRAVTTVFLTDFSVVLAEEPGVCPALCTAGGGGCCCSVGQESWQPQPAA